VDCLTEVRAHGEIGRRLVVEALRVEEAARKRVAQELHDDILQTLLAAQRVMDRCEEGDDAALAQARHALALAVSGLRRQVSELHPPALEHAGLAEALRQVGERQARLAGWRVHLQIDRGAELPHAQVLFSLARELLTNAAKHSAARNVHLRLARDRNAVVLEVDDDGVGFTRDRLDEAISEGHIGLASSRERVEALAGEFELATAPGRGTRVRIRLPARRGSDRPPSA
jgi:two-component system NarL family sensor kinase